MAKGQIRVSKVNLFGGLVLTGLILLLLPQGLTNSINFAFVRIFGFCLNVGSSYGYYPNVFNRPSSDYVSRETYNQLWIANANLYADYLEEQKRRKQLEGIRATLPDPQIKPIIASVISLRKKQLIINRGSSFGIKTGQYVLGNNSVIGTVGDVSANSASVYLITHPACSIYVKIAAEQDQSYVYSVLQGSKKANASQIDNVPTKYKISEGDRVYAAKRTGLLTMSRIVGKVSRCAVSQDNPLLWEIEVAPACELNKISDVAVVVMETEE